MSYSEADTSTEVGQPIELYKFEGPVAAVTYYYTSFSEDVDYDGNTYIATHPLERSVVAGGIHSDAPELTIVLPVSSYLVQTYAFNTPPRSLELTIYRMHTPSGGATVYWKGPITAFNVKGGRAVLRAPTILTDPMHLRIPSHYFQGICNRVLYDGRCTKIASEYDNDATIAAISGDTITVSDVDGQIDGYFSAGEIVRSEDGERRMILDHTGLVLTLSKAFRTLAVTDAMVMYAGCAHTIEVCRDKYDNVINYGGHPYIPNVNPFLSGLNTGE